MPEQPRILILTAVRIEARAVAATLVMTPRGQDTWKSGDIMLQVVGIRASRLARMVVPSVGVIMVGVAGGLAPHLRVADVILDGLSGGFSPDVPSAYFRALIHTGKEIAATPEEKFQIHSSTRAAAVDMENAHIRAWATEHHLLYAGIRAISDTADHMLDPAMLTLVDDVGGIRPAALVKLLITRPGLIPPLRTLGANTQRAAQAAATALKEILNAGWPAVDDQI